MQVEGHGALACTSVLDSENQPAWFATNKRINEALQFDSDALYNDSKTSTDGRPQTLASFRIKALIEAHEALKPWKASEPEKRYAGFFRHRQMLMHPWMLAILGSLLLYRSRETGSLFIGQSSCLALQLFIATRSMHWLRAFSWSHFADPKRQIYSYTHWDLYPLGFLVDHVFYFLMCWMVAALCVGWWQVKFDSRAASFGEPLRIEILSDFTKAFNEWQIATTALGCAFVYLTMVYWRITTADRDMGYLGSAVLVHCLWTFAWASATWPLWRAWDRWQKERTRLIHAAWLPKEDDPGNIEQRKLTLEILREIHPVGTWRLAATAIVGTISYVGPALKFIMELL